MAVIPHPSANGAKRHGVGRLAPALAALLLIVAVPAVLAEDDSRISKTGWAPDPAEQPVAFRGLRMGMTPAQVRAAGYAQGRILGHASGAIGFALVPFQAPDIREMAAYFVHEKLFELEIRFVPLPESAARAFTGRLYETLRAPADTPDGMRVAVRWEVEQLIVRYSAQPMGDGGFAPDLLLQDQGGYLEARVFFSQIEYSH